MAELKIGNNAPGFKGKTLALYFYPKDNTPGCTKEACSLRDGYKKLKKAGVEVVGVSPDTEQSHKKFTTKYKLPFKLIADPDKILAKKYGVWGKKKFLGKEFFGIKRTTFIIKKGKIKHIIRTVDTANHAEQILKLIK